ncbi:MAG TPA: hypothetical protein VGB64_15145 [Actinomycetota bacterium]
MAGGLALALLSTILPATMSQRASSATRLPVPEDRYAMAGGCYGVRSVAAGGWVQRSGGSYAATGASLGEAEPFFFKATDLGSYLLFDTAESHLAADAGLVGDLADEVHRSTPGGYADGLSGGASEDAAKAVAASALGDATGRGSALVGAAIASDLADWTVEQTGPGTFSFTLPATEQGLVTGPGGALALTDVATDFALQLTTGCTEFPEVQINIDGPVATGDTAIAEVRGYLDAHVHMMAYEFIGGRSRCGRPWHRYGVTQALIDCPDHEPGGRGAVLETVLGSPASHDTVGWPTFGFWPRYNSLTHEQLYYKWLERAWRGGLRLFVNLLVDNAALCKIYPYRQNSCNEMDGVRLQAERIRELERYIDAQEGGPGEGWFRIATDPFQARRLINGGKLAVVLGIEVSTPLDCGLVRDIPTCDQAKIDREMQAVYDLGVRQMELVNKFDNALSGVTGDGGSTGVVVNQGNMSETGSYWQMQTCEDGHEHDKPQINVHDDATKSEFTGRDSVFAGVLSLAASNGVPAYPAGPHCNTRGLTDLGRHMLDAMMSRGMIFDPDHMSAKARSEAMDYIEAAGYPGVVSSHSWADDSTYRRVIEMGGVVTPYAGSSAGFVNDWNKTKGWADIDTFGFALGYGSDVNGFGAQGPPRGAGNPNKVTYPFTGFGGVTVDKQRSGERVYDVNTDGVAHYGLYPDWLQDLRKIAGDTILEDMEKGPEAYLQMWERAVGIAPNACRNDVDDLTDAQVANVTAGMNPEQVLRTLGQPASRQTNEFAYCMTGARTARVVFAGEDVTNVIVS